MELNKAVIERLSSPMLRTWNAIGYDIYQSYADMGEELDNEDAIESCIDANRIDTYGEDPKAGKLVSALITAHGYPKVLKFLSKHFPFA
jgi:hypothetical protein